MYFMKYKVEEIKKIMIVEVCFMVGFGFLFSVYDQNGNECMNFVF